MPDLTPLRIFVASPGDVKPERERLAQVVQDLDVTLARGLGLVLELKRWEDLHGVDAAGPQAIIDPHIRDADIFVLIFWARFGTPDASGGYPTRHEFELALERFRKSGRPRILFYRKNQDLPPARIDTEQLRLVNEFEKSFWAVGLVKPFQQPDHFMRLVTFDLIQEIQTMRPHAAAPAAYPPAPAPIYLGQLPAAQKFVGRASELDRLRRWARERTSPRLAIWGRPGIGKTELALRFVEEVRADPDLFPGGVLTADFCGGPKVRETLLAWAEALRMAGGSQAPAGDSIGTEVLRDLIGRELCRNPLPKLFLILNIAGVEQSREFVLGVPNAFYLLTTVEQPLAMEFAGSENVVEVGELSGDDALELLRHYAGRIADQEVGAARRLLELAGTDALTVTILARWLMREQSCGRGQSLAALVSQFEQARLPGSPNAGEAMPASLSEEMARVMSVVERSLDRESAWALRTLWNVFPAHPSTFSSEAARTVLASDAATLDRLVSVGLLRVEGNGASGRRFSFSPNLYGLQLIGPAGDALQAAEQRMAAYYADLVRSHPPAGQELAGERGNIEQAARIAARRGWDEQTITIGLAFSRFLNREGFPDSAARLLDRAAEAARRAGDARREAQALRQRGLLALESGSHSEAIACYRKALALTGDASRTDLRTDLLTNLGYARDRTGESEPAEESLREGLRLAETAGDLRRGCKVRQVLGWVYAHRGDYEAARRCWHDGLEQAGRIAGGPRPDDEVMGLHADLQADLGWVEERLGSLESADRHLEKARTIANALPNRRHWFRVATNLAAAAIHRGDYRRAQDLLEPAVEEARRKASLNRLSILEENLGLVLLRRGDDGRAEELLDQGLQHATTADDPERIAALLTYLGELARYRGRFPEAERYLLVGLSLGRRAGNRERASELALNLGLLYTELARTPAAEACLQDALKHANEIGYRWMSSAAHNARGAFFLAAGEASRAEAEAEFQEARRIALAIGSRDNEALALLGLAELERNAGRRLQAQQLERSGWGLLREIGHRLARADAARARAVG